MTFFAPSPDKVNLAFGEKKSSTQEEQILRNEEACNDN